MPISISDPRKAYHELRAETDEAVRAVLDSGQYVLGKPVLELEQAFARLAGSRQAVGVSSGTDALLLSLQALGIGSGDEVIVPAFTFVASGSMVARLGAKAVFADIDPATFQMDPAALAAAVSGRTRAIVAVHLYGYAAPVERYRQVLDERGASAPIVEDAAQAIGTRWKAAAGDELIHAGAFGRLGCFSFYPTKNLPACGEAGLVITSDDELAERLRELRNQGQDAPYRHSLLGANCRLDAVQGAILGVRLPHVERWNERRRALAALYDRLFTESRLPVKVEGFLLPPQPAPGSVCNYHQYTLRVPRRDDLVAFLRERGVGAGVYYPIPLPYQPIFAELGHREGDFPHSEAAARTVVSLPIHQFLADEDVERVAAAVEEFYSRSS